MPVVRGRLAALLSGAHTGRPIAAMGCAATCAPEALTSWGEEGRAGWGVGPTQVCAPTAEQRRQPQVRRKGERMCFLDRLYIFGFTSPIERKVGRGRRGLLGRGSGEALRVVGRLGASRQCSDGPSKRGTLQTPQVSLHLQHLAALPTKHYVLALEQLGRDPHAEQAQEQRRGTRCQKGEQRDGLAAEHFREQDLLA